jgi:hypothetical protein
MVRTPDPGNALALVGITIIDPVSTSGALVDQTVLISDGFIRGQLFDRARLDSLLGEVRASAVGR